MSGEAESRLYLVTPERMDGAEFATLLQQVLATIPIACVRLDLGTVGDEAQWRSAVNHLLPVCHEQDVPLLIAEHYRLVRPLGLDGVHLRAGKAPIRSVRKELGSDAIIGADGGTERHTAMTLAEAGADYVCLGPVGDTGTLGAGDTAKAELFEWWSEMIETPVVAEGGLDPATARVLALHADFMVPDRRMWDRFEDVIALLQDFSAILADPSEQEPGG